MSHKVGVTLIADQEIDICGRRVNIHDIMSIIVDADGKITDAYLASANEEKYEGWLSGEVSGHSGKST